MKNINIILLAITFFSLAYQRYATRPKSQETQKRGTSLAGNKKNPEHEPLYGTIHASDGQELAYRAYVPDCPEAVLLFYHGSGAHGGAGYPYMAERLANTYGVAGYLFDVRGHGRSSGPRGHTPMPQQVWNDVLTAFEWAQQQYPTLPIFLSGHSGGAGILLNYAQWQEHKEPAGYMLITPFFGKEVDIYREREKKQGKGSFATVHYTALGVNMITGGLIAGDWTGITMHYPEHCVTEQGFVNAYTVNMIHALNAREPIDTLYKIKVPTHIVIADQDELFDPRKMDNLLLPVVNSNNLVHVEHLADAKHLTVLGEVDEYIGKTIRIDLK